MRSFVVCYAALAAVGAALHPSERFGSSALDPEIDELIGVRTPGAHKGRSNPDAVQDGWPDCSVPDSANNYYTQCSPEPGYFSKPADQPRVVVIGSSFTAGVGSPHKNVTWPSLLASLMPTASVTNFGAGASTALKKSSGGPGDLTIWGRPQWRAFQQHTWDVVVFVLGHNDCKTAFWPKNCSDESTMLTCPFAKDYLELIRIAKSRGRNGNEAKVLLAQEGDPTCCVEGARTCSDFSGPPGCAYCMKCEKSLATEVDSEVRMVHYPTILKKIAAAANIPYSDALPRATPETPPERCAFPGGSANEFGPGLSANWAAPFRKMIQDGSHARGSCPGGGLPLPEKCPYHGRCCHCHAGARTDALIAEKLAVDFVRHGLLPEEMMHAPPASEEALFKLAEKPNSKLPPIQKKADAGLKVQLDKDVKEKEGEAKEKEGEAKEKEGEAGLKEKLEKEVKKGEAGLKVQLEKEVKKGAAGLKMQLEKEVKEVQRLTDVNKVLERELVKAVLQRGMAEDDNTKLESKMKQLQGAMRGLEGTEEKAR